MEIEYRLRNKTTKEFACLSTRSNEGRDFCGETTTEIGRFGESVFAVNSITKALTALYISTPWYNSCPEKPEWSTKDFGDTHEVVEIEINPKTVTGFDEIIVLSKLVNFDQTLFCMEAPEEYIEAIDQELTENALFPDRMTYEYKAYMTTVALEELKPYEGRTGFLSPDTDELYFFSHVAEYGKPDDEGKRATIIVVNVIK